MSQAQHIKTSLAFLTGIDHERYLVLARDYGAVIAVILDDSIFTENTVLRVPSQTALELLEPYADDIVAAELSEQYDQLQLYLLQNDRSLLGPLTSARAALAMKRDNLTPESAIEVATQQGALLTERQIERLKIVQRALAS